MRYRNRQSNSPRTIIAKFAGKCHCCGGDIPAGKMVDYHPGKRVIAHYKAFNGDSPECYGVLKQQVDPGLGPAPRQFELENTAADPAGLARKLAQSPLRPLRPQSPCDTGLFSDDPRQIDLEDLIARTPPRG